LQKQSTGAFLRFFSTFLIERVINLTLNRH
jgi:hypothetical protein